MKKTILCSLPVIAISVIVLIAFSACTDLDSLMTIRETGYIAQTEDEKIIFHEGSAIRKEGFPIRLTLQGNYYEMGLQYGALLKTEFSGLMDYGRDQINTIAKEENIPPTFIIAYLLPKTRNLYKRIPRRFHELFKGVSDGSGVPLDTIILFNFLDYVMEIENSTMAACASVVINDASGHLYHSWHRDDTRGDYFSRNAIIVHWIPDGYESWYETHIITPLGTDGGINASGICVTNNSRTPRSFDDLLDWRFLSRMILEECKGFDDIDALLDQVSVGTSISLHISDSKTGTAWIYELVSGKKTAWKSTAMTGNVQWNLNRYFDAEFSSKYEDRYLADSLYQKNREAQFSSFFRDSSDRVYSLDDLVSAMRINESEDSVDRIRTSLEDSVVNAWTTKMVIHGPEGIYLARSEGYLSSLSDIFLYPYDFSQEPILKYAAIPIPDAYRTYGRIIAVDQPASEKLNMMKSLSDSYPDIGLYAFQTALLAKEAERESIWSVYAQRAYENNPNVVEYSVEAALSLFAQGELKKAVEILRDPSMEKLYTMEYRFIRLILLSKIYEQSGDSDRAQTHRELAADLPIWANYRKEIDGYLDGLIKEH